MWKGNLFLLSAAIFWGATFIAQKTAMDSMGPFTFTGVRFLIGTLCLIPVFLLWPKPKTETEETSSTKIFPLSKSIKTIMVVEGGILGAVMFMGINFQQVGLIYTSPTHASLLTSTYVFLVPLILVFFHRKIPKHIIGIGILIFIGICLLTINPNEEKSLLEITGPINHILLGDALSLICAGFWAVHIIWLEKYLHQGSSPLALMIGQSFWAGSVSLIIALIFENPTLEKLLNHQWEFVIGGVFSIALGFTFQAVGQKYARASVAAILLSTESLFATLADYIFLDRLLSVPAYFGAVIILVGIILVQMWPTEKIQPS